MRQAGQSAKEKLDEFVDDNALKAVLPAGFMLFWLFIELMARYSKARISPWLLGVLSVLAIVHLFVRIRRVRHEAKKQRQGLYGEQYVAQIIERDLISQGYRVFHDLVFEKDTRKFNIDHLLVGPKGVFCIETKTWSKPMRGETIATFDGKFIYLNGKVCHHDAVGQACALAHEASAFIKQLTGLALNVVPVVVVVGWYVRKTYAGVPKVLVVNEEALAVFVENCPSSMKKTDIDLVSQKIASANLAKQINR